MKKQLVLAGALFLLTSTTGCFSHQVALDPDFSYQIEASTKEAPLTVVIDEQTLHRVVPIKSWMTGIAHKWNAEPGKMLQQVADIEFPQVFTDYQMVDFYESSLHQGNRTVIELFVPYYNFANFHAMITVQAIAHSQDETILFDNEYQEEGFGQGSKMFWAGAFGMKSAIRQSSLDAYKKIFTRLRKDIHNALKAAQ